MHFSNFKLSHYFAFGSLLRIYNNKIAHLTLSEDNMIGVIIEDKNINTMHRSLFEFTWQHAKKLDEL